ncbi:hypothetical protein G5V58_22095 [Nocardioides anomalus]|uniref:RCC1-like domain-containing protein n=1 Tax=Nocardioides anomalus TaxID=2712223 RepID=A0A6G6WIR6_9ACTN|nr:RCC1 domain-containing protein [Nocardioides anomalus]QIG45096.1 hypothetical protein G5V58_22095 [Nocardioides anomalus]
MLVRRLAVAALLAAGLVLPGAAPAPADTSEGAPGVPRLDAAALTAGADHSCAIVGTGEVRCWGAGNRGQLGQGSTADVGDDPGESTVPVAVGTGRAVSIAAGADHTCAVLDTGQLRCWGRNDHGQLGQGTKADVGDGPGETTVAVDLGPGRTAVAVSAGALHTCAIVDTGQLRCWGASGSGQLGQGNTVDIGDDPGETTVPVDLGPGRTAVAVAAGNSHTCAVVDTGQVRCWGSAFAGQLGQGNTTTVGDDPGETTVGVDLGAGRTATAISALGNATCVVLDTGQVRCWGDGAYGELAQGNTSPVGDSPGETTAAVDLGGRRAVALSGGFGHACAVLDTGQLRCWGLGGGGQLGQGSSQYVGDEPGETTVPVDLGPGRTVLAVAAGHDHTCAVTTGGELRCWGHDDRGQLGQGTSVSYGDGPGEVPANLPPVQLGGQRVGRDADGDGVRDSVDACPTSAGVGPTGCPAPPEAVLTKRKVRLDTVLARQGSRGSCPKRADVRVVTKGKHGRISVRKELKARPVDQGCRVTGTVRLPAKPKKSAAVKVKVSGKRLVTKRLVAVRR